MGQQIYERVTEQDLDDANTRIAELERTVASAAERIATLESSARPRVLRITELESQLRIEQHANTALVHANTLLTARVCEAEGEGCTLHGHAPHGQEAEELRKGLEQLLKNTATATVFDAGWRTMLHELLDGVAARDSLAHLRANERLAELGAENATLRETLSAHWACWADALWSADDASRPAQPADCSTREAMQLLLDRHVELMSEGHEHMQAERAIADAAIAQVNAYMAPEQQS